MNVETADTKTRSWAQPLASLAVRPLRFLNETLLRQRPPTRWTTPSRVIREDDDDWMQRHHRMQDWYRSPKDLPGPLYLRAVRELFKENRLIQGRLVSCGRTVDLGAIRCPLCLVAGRRDHITPPPQLWAARGAVSSQRVHEVETDGGHIGTFMERAELREQWPGIFAWIRKESPNAQ